MFRQRVKGHATTANSGAEERAVLLKDLREHAPQNAKSEEKT